MTMLLTHMTDLPELPFALDEISLAFASQTANDEWRVAVIGSPFTVRAARFALVRGSLSEAHAKHTAALINRAATAARALLR